METQLQYKMLNNKRDVKHTYKFRWIPFIKSLTQTNKSLRILNSRAFTMSSNMETFFKRYYKFQKDFDHKESKYTTYPLH